MHTFNIKGTITPLQAKNSASGSNFFYTLQAIKADGSANFVDDLFEIQSPIAGTDCTFNIDTSYNDACWLWKTFFRDYLLWFEWYK